MKQEIASVAAPQELIEPIAPHVDKKPRLPRWRRTAAGLGAMLTFLAGPVGTAEAHEVGQPPDVVYSQQDNTRNRCAEPAVPAVDSLTDSRSQLDTLSQTLETAEEPRDIEAVLDRLEHLYHTPFNLYQGPPETETNATVELWGVDLSDPETLNIVASQMQGFLERLDDIPPEMLQVSAIEEIRLVAALRMVGQDGGEANTYGGFVTYDTNIMAIKLAEASTTIPIHEIGHLLDRAICGGTDYHIDQKFRQDNSFAYIGLDEYFRNGGMGLPPAIRQPGPDQEIARAYGGVSVAEDRATIIEWLVNCGLIEAGHPSEGSVFDGKLNELARRFRLVFGPAIVEWFGRDNGDSPACHPDGAQPLPSRSGGSPQGPRAEWYYAEAA